MVSLLVLVDFLVTHRELPAYLFPLDPIGRHILQILATPNTLEVYTTNGNFCLRFGVTSTSTAKRQAADNDLEETT
jgi:hypothetical protein